MKILWAKSDFLHPTTRGGQIRSLEILKRLHRRHEVHYVALHQPGETEGIERSSEYCSCAYPIPHRVVSRRSLAFAGELAAGLFSPVPVAIGRFSSAAMRVKVGELLARDHFDAVVCDFLHAAPAIDALERAVLFQHNVETVIWQRNAQHAGDPLRRSYLRMQANRMFEYERRVCRKVRKIVAVSATDAHTMERMFGVKNVAISPTGVDADYFERDGDPDYRFDLCFVGSMDWLANTDAMMYFHESVLPLIHARRPDCTIAIVGRRPTPEILRLGNEPGVTVTGTVPDVRPFLWQSRISIVPLRIGGGTRLKIYEAMAAGTPVISTSVGAEGLEVAHPEHIRIADSPADFAGQCIRLLNAEPERRALAAGALERVRNRFSWEMVARTFEDALIS